MPSFSLSSPIPIPYPLHLESLQMWGNWLTEYSNPPSWMLNEVDDTLGFERAIDIAWLAILLPQLSEYNFNTPTWMGNLQHLAKIYKTGVDLLSPTVIRDMDVGDLKGLFPSAHDSEIARDIVYTYKAYIDLRKAYGHPAHDLQLQHNDWLDQWSIKWTQGLQQMDLPVQMYDVLPSIQQLAVRAHQPLNISTLNNIITPTTIQVLWSSGLLDSAVDIITEEAETPDKKTDASAIDGLPDTIIASGTWAVHRLHEMTNLPKSEIVLRIHNFFEQALQSPESRLRPWLWGHTPIIITQPK